MLSSLTLSRELYLFLNSYRKDVDLDLCCKPLPYFQSVDELQASMKMAAESQMKNYASHKLLFC